jgi:hypothetical protein
MAKNFTPLERKRLLGNSGRRTMPPQPVLELRAVSQADLDAVPEHLGPEGLALWNSAWGNAASWLSPDSDLPLVIAACEMADSVETARERLNVTGTPQDTRALTGLTSQLVTMLSLLGFTPKDRQKLGIRL